MQQVPRRFENPLGNGRSLCTPSYPSLLEHPTHLIPEWNRCAFNEKMPPVPMIPPQSGSIGSLSPRTCAPDSLIKKKPCRAPPPWHGWMPASLVTQQPEPRAVCVRVERPSNQASLITPYLLCSSGYRAL